MYKVLIDDVVVHDSTTNETYDKLIDPKLTFADNSAGSFTFTITQNNPGYYSMKRLTSRVIVYRDNTLYWAGRIISESTDFYNKKSVTCEGEMGYLYDTVQEPQKYEESSVQAYLDSVIAKHNAKATEDYKKFEGVKVVDSQHKTINRTTNYETSLDSILQVAKDNEAHVKVGRENGKLYLYYYDKYVNTSIQTIEFGKNLLDYTKNWDASNFYTVILPRGSRKSAMSPLGVDQYVNISEVNNGSMYLESPQAIETYGRIEKVIDFPDITRGDRLLLKALEYISDIQFDDLVIEIKAVDMSYLNPDLKFINLLDQIRCISAPHGLNKIFPVLKITVPLNKPENTEYILSTSSKVGFSSSGSASSGLVAQLKKSISDTNLAASNMVSAARENAQNIMDMKTNGFITITVSEGDEYHSEALIISDKKDLDQAVRYWKWNVNGLAYYDRTNDNPIYEVDSDGNPITDEDGELQPKLAITMDGSIVADYITTGVLNATLIRAGIITDLKNNVSWNLESGDFSMTKGSITLGNNFKVTSDGIVTINRGSISLGGNFSVNDQGEVEINKGSITLGNNFSVTSDGIVTINRGSISLGSNFSVNDQGEVEINKGSISLGGNFYVDSDGYMEAYEGKFYGKLVGATGSFEGSLDVGDGMFVVDSDGNVSSYGSMVLGGDIFLSGSITSSVFGIYSDPENGTGLCGYMGRAYGLDGDTEQRTNGVAISAGNSYNSNYGAIYPDSNHPYIIVTTSGVRMQVGEARIVVVDGDASLYCGDNRLYIKDDSAGMIINGTNYDLTDLGTGTATFG